MAGRDVTEAGFDFKPNQPTGEVELEFTNVLSGVSGQVRDGRGQRARDYTAVMFPKDDTNWTWLSRFLSQARPDQEGQFTIRPLPPGDYYIVAVDRLDIGEGRDRAFLDEHEARTVELFLAAMAAGGRHQQRLNSRLI